MTAIVEDELGSPDVARLVRRAAEGDLQAWERLVDQYARLIWSITGEFKLVESDAADVVQTTWLRLARAHRPDRVPGPGGFLARGHGAERVPALPGRAQEGRARPGRYRVRRPAVPEPPVDERLLAAERAQVVREALSHLPGRWQRLLEMLMADPPMPYAEISDELGLPVGSIGPTRGRCLARLRVLLEAA